MHGRHARAGHVGDQADPCGEEPRVLLRTGHVRGHLGREGPEDHRGVDPDLLEQPAVHHRHHAAAARLADPGLALEPAGFARIQVGGRGVLEGLEGRQDPVTQRFEPGARPGLAVFKKR